MFHPLENDQKCAEVFRSDYGIYSFVCYHCGAMFPSFEQVTPHIESHFTAEPLVIYPEECFDEKYDLVVEAIDHEIYPEEKHELVDVIDNICIEQDSDHKDLFSAVQEEIVSDKKKDITDENVLNNFANHDEHKVNIKTELFQNVQNKNLVKTEKLICDICKNEYSLKKYLLVHIKSHASPFKCPMCSKRFKHVENLRMHGLQCHSNEDVEDIIHISAGLAEIEKLKRPYKCDVCQKIVKGKLQMFYHISRHENKKQFKCNICGSGFNQLENKKSHMLVHDSNLKNYKCDLCQQAFRNKSILACHLQLHRDDRAYQCKECNKNFKNPTSLKIHVRRVHRKEKKSQCSDCGKAFFSISHFNEHMKDHTDGPFTCEVCNKVFKVYKQFLVHKKLHTDERLFKCDLCDKSYKSSKYLWEHRFVHFEKNFKCKFCDKKFNQYNTRRTHEVNFHRQIKTDKINPTIQKLHVQKTSAHQKEKNEQCPICGKTFSYISILNVHMKDHTDGPFTCDGCNKVFKTSNLLIIHKRTHTEQRFYKCDICDKSFTTSKYLWEHRFIHFDKKLKCKFCDKKFHQYTTRRSHEVRVHRQIKRGDLKKN